MSLTVLNVAYPLAPVGPDAVGGAEQVLSRLDEGLVKAGHRSLVVASEGSVTAGTLLTVPCWRSVLNEGVRARAWEYHRQAIAQALRRWPVQLIHLHGIDFYQYLPPPGPPVLVTLHLPLHWYPPRALSPKRPRTFLHCVSNSQRQTNPHQATLLEDIENGVPAGLFRARHAKRRFVLSLGRICPEKGFHLALEAAREAGVPLILAGEAFGYPEHLHYFHSEIEPRLDALRRFIGPAGSTRKRRLLCAARCLLAPSLAPETSCLAAIEALACGTPVIAFPSGALAEIIQPGRNGFLVRTPAEMAEAIQATDTLNPQECRQTVARFAVDRMLGKYFELYQRLVDTCAEEERHSPGRIAGGDNDEHDRGVGDHAGVGEVELRMG